MRLPAAMDAWIVDDDTELLASIAESLAERHWTTFRFSTAHGLIEQLKNSVPGCVLIGHSIDGRSGVELIKHLHATTWPAPAILMSGQLTPSLTLQAVRAGVFGVLEKPFRLSDLHSEIEIARTHALRLAERLYCQEGAQTMINALNVSQRDVMALLVECVPTKQIASRLHVCLRTVEKRKHEICAILGVENHVQLLKLVRLAQSPLTPKTCAPFPFAA